MKKLFKLALASALFGAAAVQAAPRAFAQDDRTPSAGESDDVKPNAVRADGSVQPATGRNADEFSPSIIDAWPEKPRATAKLLIDKYGAPDEATSKTLVWRNNGPWKRTVLSSEEVDHQFPAKHTDFLAQTVNYKVPAGKAGDLIKFDGSLIVDRTRGELTSRCDKEENNRLALNLADEIVRGKRSADDARKFLAKSVETSASGKSSPYVEDLRFTPQSADVTADPDSAK